jgi:hypothetical protein
MPLLKLRNLLLFVYNCTACDELFMEDEFDALSQWALPRI